MVKCIRLYSKKDGRQSLSINFISSFDEAEKVFEAIQLDLGMVKVEEINGPDTIVEICQLDGCKITFVYDYPIDTEIDVEGEQAEVVAQDIALWCQEYFAYPIRRVRRRRRFSLFGLFHSAKSTDH